MKWTSQRWIYSHFMYRKWNKKIKANLCNWKNGQAFRHIQTRAAFSACIRQSNKKRWPPPTNVASLASLGNGSNSNDAVTKIKVRNYEELTNFGCLVWETWIPIFFLSVFWGHCVFQVSLSGLVCSCDRLASLQIWIQVSWGGCLENEGRVALGECFDLCDLPYIILEFNGHLLRMASVPLNMNSSFSSFTFLPPLFHAFQHL